MNNFELLIAAKSIQTAICQFETGSSFGPLSAMPLYYPLIVSGFANLQHTNMLIYEKNGLLFAIFFKATGFAVWIVKKYLTIS